MLLVRGFVDVIRSRPCGATFYFFAYASCIDKVLEFEKTEIIDFNVFRILVSFMSPRILIGFVTFKNIDSADYKSVPKKTKE